MAISMAWRAERGDLVESQYRVYADTLSSYFELLRNRITRDAPAFLSELEPPPESPLAYGYQVLPKLTETLPGKSSSSNASRVYSWPITERYIEGELGKIRAAQAVLAEPDPPYAQLAREYRILISNEAVIAQHVQYNRFWQKTIAVDRQRFDHQTTLYRAAIDLRDATEPARAAELRGIIQEGAPRPVLPSFVKIERPSRSRVVMRLPVYTDIDDREFLKSVKAAVEKAWHAKDGDIEFQVEVVFSYQAATELYRERRPPAQEEPLDLESHIRRFPATGAVLTTGANSTHAFPGRSIALGPQPLTWNEVAHEFGHLLGFVDSYIRGYQDLGDDGFEIFETITDPEDIMSAPGDGRVFPTHFETLMSLPASP